MRKLYEFSPNEYQRLLDSGFLFEFYPNAKGTFDLDVLHTKEFSKMLNNSTISYSELFYMFEEYAEQLTDIDLDSWLSEKEGFKEWVLQFKLFGVRK